MVARTIKRVYPTMWDKTIEPTKLVPSTIGNRLKKGYFIMILSWIDKGEERDRTFYSVSPPVFPIQ